MGFYNKDGEMLIHSEDKKTGLILWVLLIICVAFYLGFNVLIIHLAYIDNFVIFNINKFTISGMVAQGQVIAIILLTVNPLKRSRQIALALCGITCTVALISVLMAGTMDALPGVIVPITSGTICIIITLYAKRLKNQSNRVRDYSRIVKKNEEMLHSLAYYDALTGLPNRKTLMDQVEMLTTIKDGSCFYLVYIDINDFKKINDMMGHSVGDAVLQEIAQRWKRYCRNEDMLARVGGDEFIILICYETDIRQLHEYLKGIVSVLSEPVSIGRKDFTISVSYGVTRYPDDGDSAEELLKNADIALYNAKKLGKNEYQFFSSTLKEEVLRRIRLENDLVSAVRNQELFVVYQPQYTCGTLNLRGFEALARWRHPELGMIRPIEFIAIAEEAGIIDEIGKWIIEAALKAFITLQEEAQIKTIISINISVKQLLSPSFVGMVSSILKETGFESRYLEFEITESVFISNPEYVIGAINQIKDLGIGIALDDFGTRYASLSYLQMLPINILKIDKTFVDKITPQHQMTGAIIALSHRLGLEVVAEGVEHQSQLKYLTEQGCDFLQGYLLSKPVDESRVAEVYYASAQALQVL